MKSQCVFPWLWHKKRPAFLYRVPALDTTKLICVRCGRTWGS